MKKSNKGFTLIELLAVVVIMLAISVMAVSSISAAIKRNNKKQDDSKKRVLESYAELYYQKNKNTLGGVNEIKVRQLISEFQLSPKEVRDSSDNEFDGCIKIIREYTTTFEYVERNQCSG